MYSSPKLFDRLLVRDGNDPSNDLTDSRCPDPRSFGLFFFAGNGGLNRCRAVSAKYNNNNNKLSLSDSTSRRNFRLLSLDTLLCFVLKM